MTRGIDRSSYTSVRKESSVHASMLPLTRKSSHMTSSVSKFVKQHLPWWCSPKPTIPLVATGTQVACPTAHCPTSRGWKATELLSLKDQSGAMDRTLRCITCPATCNLFKANLSTGSPSQETVATLRSSPQYLINTILPQECHRIHQRE